MGKSSLVKREVLKNVTKDSEAMEKAFSLCLKEIESVLGGERGITDLTKLAAATLGGYSRIKSTEIHDKALEIMLARSAKSITG